MAASKPKLSLRQRLAIYDRRRELERRASDGVTAEVLRMQTDPDFDPEISRLPHARPAQLNPDAVHETRRAVAQALAEADRQTRTRRAQLAAIAADVLPHTPGWERRRADWT
jgi:hypothetical protein